MVLIPDGTFTMGAPETEESSRDNERPQHDVTISSFLMGRYPITQQQWQAIATRTDLKVEIDLEEDPSHFKDHYV
ncbi:MAG: SUMF1/EgtB/PvdO family nonheme iron enzyme [Crocosphaera sp.]|nr:SUMF1/EgtB/PvdO family nonheme iron enzyme [Crocosphaera sp.]